MTETNKTTVNQLRTPLYESIVAGGARFTAFAGWDMPVQYIGLKQEHLAVRNAVGMFDISHMGKFFLQGDDLVKQLQKLVPTDLGQLTPGKAQYTVLLNRDGGIIDDIIFYLLADTSPQRGILIVNAATTDKDKVWIQQNLSSSIELEDKSTELVLIALQGPEAAATLSQIVGSKLEHLGAFEHCSLEIFGQSAFVARTGYTGEDGFEIMVSAEIGQQLWQQLIELGVTPCGLGARDTLRLEAGMCLYGQDMDDTTTPLEAGLGWLVDWDKDFIGKSVLQQQRQRGIPRKLVGLKMLGRGIARHDYPIVADGEQVGVVTSGTLGPSLDSAIALAYVPKALSRVGQELAVEIRGKLYPAQVVKKPFYRRSK